MIPEGWSEVRLGELGRLQSGVGFPLHFQGRKVGEIPFYKVSDMNLPANSRFMCDANNWVSEVDSRALGAVPLPPGAIVFAKVGAAVFLERKRILTMQSCVDNNMMALVPETDRCDTRFLHFALQRIRFGDLVSATALPSINALGVSGITISLPSLTEQQAIAEALSDADALVESLDALIAKKRDMKQAAMQQLLTGRTRLVGFTNGMRAVRLGDVVRMESGTYLPQTRYSGGQVKVQGAGGQMGWTDKPNFLQPVTVIGRVGTIGKPRFHDHDCWVNNNAAALVCTSVISPKFLYFVVQALDFGRFTSTTAQPFLSVPDFLSAVLSLPSLEEQQAIEAVLWDMDAEIDALVAQREKAELVKQGMMQELLSGRVRLV